MAAVKLETFRPRVTSGTSVFADDVGLDIQMRKNICGLRERNIQEVKEGLSLENTQGSGSPVQELSFLVKNVASTWRTSRRAI
jgi:hypothetical protein